MKKSVRAVITCDLVGYSGYDKEVKASINQRIVSFVEEYASQNGREFIIYRGDSLQGVVKKPKEALRLAIYLKSLLNSFGVNKGKRSSMVDIRISIGIGEVDFEGKNLLDSDGEAFHNSGRTLDGMKNNNRTLAFTSSKDRWNREWDVILVLLEEVMRGWSVASAEIVSKLLWVDNEVKVSEMLSISQPAVNLRKKHAGWDSIKKTIEYYEAKFK